QSESLSFALHAIQRSAERGQTLVDDVMHLTQLSNKNCKLERINPTELLNQVAKDSDLALERAQGTIHFLGDKHSIMGDPKLLRTIYRNLLANAIKFRSSERPLAIEHIVSDTGTGHVRVEFTDNGVGFDPDKAAQIFEPFTRLVGDDQVEGTGLGLAIVKEASAAMGYRVSASSAPAVGTTIAMMAPSAD
ncbi:MAG: sensor histidine kinase, partial [Granulosicoccaceae bacterium]